jgi:hypothetical protein
MRLLVVVAALLGLFWVALPAMACSRMPPLELDDLLGGTSWAEQIDGVFEYQHISWTPHLGYRDARSVSIVTRYWGSEPKESGLEIHGDHNMLMTNSCPNGSASLGTAGYSLVDPDEPSYRTAELIAVVGELSPAQATLLEDRFGPPVERPVLLTARAAAWGLVLWQPVLLLGVVVAGSAWLVKRRSGGANG